MKRNNFFAKTLFETNSNLVSLCLLLLRCTIGILLFVAGSGKLLGWFGGYGLEASIQGYNKMGISTILTYLSIYTEFIGGLLLTIGLLTRPVAFAIMINMLVATLVTLPNGFMGPTGAQTAFIFLVIDIVILLAGPMAYSADAPIFKSQGNT
jgi:putative oxidoreductase